MLFVSATRTRRQARATAALQADLVAARAHGAQASVYRAALETLHETTSAVKVPNGTTRKIDRIVAEALASA